MLRRHNGYDRWSPACVQFTNKYFIVLSDGAHVALLYNLLPTSKYYSLIEGTNFTRFYQVG